MPQSAKRQKMSVGEKNAAFKAKFGNKSRPRQKTIASVSTFQDNARQERKDITINLGAVPWIATALANATITLLNPCVYGTGSNQHVGRSTHMKSVQYRMSMQASGAGTGAPNTLRIMIVYDKESNGALPIVTDVLVAQDATAPMNLTNSDRFIILSDKVVIPNFVGNGAATAPIIDYSFEMYRKIGLPCQFTATSNANVTDIATGAVFALTFLTNPGGATTVFTSQAYSRIRYTDA